MRKIIDRAIPALILVALVVSVIGLVTQSSTVTRVGLIILMVIAVAYAAIQVISYVLNNNPKEEKKNLIFTLVTSVVVIGILCVGTLVLMGKLF